MGKISYIYEINTRIWLRELSSRYRKEIRLDNVPDEEIERLKELGFDAVWLMGTWLSSGKGREAAFNDHRMMNEFRTALPDLKPEDISSSPYSIAGYEIDGSIGDSGGTSEFRERLNRKGIKLLLDFVPNHLALDHPWVSAHPDFFISGTADDLRENPESFFTIDAHILAHGRDPYFPSWRDVAQLNYYNPRTRTAMTDILLRIASLCDGVRCDMAMLVLKRIQREIWGEMVFKGGDFREPAKEFWEEAISHVRVSYPDFVFIAEVYWGLESELASLGFDYLYDKPFYDALKEMNIEKLRDGLRGRDSLNEKKIRFIENHDEERAALAFGEERSKAAALIMALSTGAHLFHQGQLEGFKTRLPVQLVRRPDEGINQGIYYFYTKLLSMLKTIREEDCRWDIMEPFSAKQEDQISGNILAFICRDSYLAVINYCGSQSQGSIRLDVAGIHAKNLILKDMLGPAEYGISKEEMISRGLYLYLEPYAFHLFKISGRD